MGVIAVQLTKTRRDRIPVVAQTVTLEMESPVEVKLIFVEIDLFVSVVLFKCIVKNLTLSFGCASWCSDQSGGKLMRQKQCGKRAK